MPDKSTDVLILEGKRYRLHTAPLGPYFQAKGEHPELRSSTDMTRGYVATWEVANGRLYLLDLKGSFEKRVGQAAC